VSGGAQGVRRSSRELAVAEEFDVDVGAQADVVGQVPADVVGVFVDDDVVAGPVPVVAIGKVKGSNAEVEAAEPEAARTAASETPDVFGAKASSEMTVRPGMIEMEAGVVGALLMADPVALGVNVRTGCRGAVLLGLRSRGMSANGRWAVLGNGRMRSLGMAAAILRESRDRTEQEQCKNCEK
jgi:hypothetical protein